MDVQRAMEFEKHIDEIIRADLDRAQVGILRRACRSIAGRSSRTTRTRTASTTPDTLVPHVVDDISRTPTARTVDVDQTLIQRITLEEELVQQRMKAALLQGYPYAYSDTTMNGWQGLPLLWH